MQIGRLNIIKKIFIRMVDSTNLTSLRKIFLSLRLIDFIIRILDFIIEKISKIDDKHIKLKGTKNRFIKSIKEKT